MKYHDYIIIGAGPAGLQMGYFLAQAGHNYLILEGTARAGAFFSQQPRHRTLISLNKCYNWFDEPDFNLRYDWNSLLTYDNSLRFPDYSKELYPHADKLVEYLNDFAEKFALNIQYNTYVSAISRQTDGERNFILSDRQGQEYQCRCLLMATGAVKPNIPENIEGIELAEGYEGLDTNPERFINKRVMILGIGNSAFELANDIAGYAAMVHLVSGGKEIKHAWQTHFVGDLRAINNTHLELGQLKMPFLTEAGKVTKITKLADGTLKVYFENDVPHWAVPGTLHGSGVYDHVIRCTGWKYVERTLFAPEVMPEVDAKSKFAVLSSLWESSVPDLFFIGAAMANNDRKTTSGFIHGFRYNIRTLFHHFQQRYHHIPLPTKTFALATVTELEALVAEIVTRISTTSALFQMFGVLGDVLLFEAGAVRWFAELPLRHVLQQSEFTANKDIVTITLELGFDSFFPKDTDALTFIHPNDPGGEGECTAFIHPVFRHYRDGQLIKEVHLKSAVFVRYDTRNDEFVEVFNSAKPRNRIKNLINSVAKISDRPFRIETFDPSEDNFFTPWPPERQVEKSNLPRCLRTHQPDFVPDPAKYV
jgi:thioredoxin reductase